MMPGLARRETSTTSGCRAWRLRSALGVIAAAAAGCLCGCPSTGAGAAYTPITGLVFRVSSVTAGHGCGEGPDQVYKYAVFVWPNPVVDASANAEVAATSACQQIDEEQMCSNAASLPSIADAGVTTGPWAGLYDCFADAVIANLPTNEAGTYTYSASLFAFDKLAYDALTTNASPSLAECGRPDQNPNFGDCLAALTGAAASATWATTCNATQVPGVPSLASCCPLATCNAPPDGGLDGGVESDATLDDGQGADAGYDATVDGNDVSEATGDASVDVGPDADASAAATDSGSATDASVDTSLDAFVDAPADADGGLDAGLGAVADASPE